MLNFEELSFAMADLDGDSVGNILWAVMADGGTEAEKALEACQNGLNVVGRRYEDGEYFVGDLIYAGKLMADAVETLKPAIKCSSVKVSGAELLICTVRNDLHDIGKNIVRSVLEANGFKVTDLGINVTPERIAETVKARRLKIVALSCVLTMSVNVMKETVEYLRRETPDCKIIIGGTPVNADVCGFTGADAWGRTPQDTVRICTEWAGEDG